MTEINFQPARILAAWFATAIIVGSLILLIPACTTSGSLSLIDAIFTATSAVCVTGLTINNIGADFTPFGQVVILILIQLGGLGIMTFSTLILMASGRKIAVKDRLFMQASFHPGIPRDFRSLLTSILAFTLIVEATGAVFFFVSFLRDFDLPRSAWLAVFHSISAFCNAGFSLFSDSFSSYRGHSGIILILILLILTGGIGFPVLREMKEIVSARLKGKRECFSFHTRLVLVMTFLLVILAALFFFAYESPKILGSAPIKERILASFFLAVTPRTAGFNTVETSILSLPSVMLVILLMFIGASPASTGGGIKTTTAGVIFLHMKARLLSRTSPEGFKRTLPRETVTTSLTLAALAMGLIFLSITGLFLSQPDLGMKQAIFEVFSAFGTVGLSMGITQQLTTAGKFVIILTMYLGRIGPLTALYALARERQGRQYEFAEEHVLIG